MISPIHKKEKKIQLVSRNGGTVIRISSFQLYGCNQVLDIKDKRLFLCCTTQTGLSAVKRLSLCRQRSNLRKVWPGWLRTCTDLLHHNFGKVREREKQALLPASVRTEEARGPNVLKQDSSPVADKGLNLEKERETQSAALVWGF